ncbi:TPA: YqjK-like family protein [Citrobacter koseri]
MSSKVERQKRKALLLSQIQQQRLDLSAGRRDWLEATDSWDHGWNTLISLRSWALVGSSVMAIWTIRHPNLLVRWAKRGFGIWSAWRLVKSTIRKQQLRG